MRRPMWNLFVSIARNGYLQQWICNVDVNLLLRASRIELVLAHHLHSKAADDEIIRQLGLMLVVASQISCPSYRALRAARGLIYLAKRR